MVFFETNAAQLGQIWEFLKEQGVDVAAEIPESNSEVVSCLTQAVKYVLQLPLTEKFTMKEMEQLLNGMVCKSLSLDGLNAANKFAESFLDSLADGKVDLIFKMMSLMFYEVSQHNCSNLVDAWVRISMHSKRDFPLSLQKLSECMERWECSEEFKRDLYRQLYRVQLHKNQNAKARATMKTLLRRFGEQASDEAAQQDAVTLIVNSINDEGVFIYDDLLELAPVKQLQGRVVYNLLQIFISGSIADYQRFYENNADEVNELGVSHEANVDKMRLLTLVDLASNNKEVYYDVIMQSLMLENDEELVEQFILDAMAKELLRCRIDEVNSKVVVSDALNRLFTMDHWRKMLSCLQQCNNQIQQTANDFSQTA